MLSYIMHDTCSGIKTAEIDSSSPDRNKLSVKSTEFRITGDDYPSTSYLLNNYEFNNRNLRVDFAENEKANMQASASGLGTKGAGAGAPVPNVPPPTQVYTLAVRILIE